MLFLDQPSWQHVINQDINTSADCRSVLYSKWNAWSFLSCHKSVIAQTTVLHAVYHYTWLRHKNIWGLYDVIMFRFDYSHRLSLERIVTLFWTCFEVLIDVLNVSSPFYFFSVLLWDFRSPALVFSLKEHRPSSPWFVLWSYTALVLATCYDSKSYLFLDWKWDVLTFSTWCKFRGSVICYCSFFLFLKKSNLLYRFYVIMFVWRSNEGQTQLWKEGNFYIRNIVRICKVECKHYNK